MRRILFLSLLLAILTACASSAGESIPAPVSAVPSGAEEDIAAPEAQESAKDPAGSDASADILLSGGGEAERKPEEPVYIPGDILTDLEEITDYLAAFPRTYQEMQTKTGLVQCTNGEDSPESMAVWEAFCAGCETGEPAAVTIVNYTVEGDPILYYLTYDGSVYTLTMDTTRDTYGVPEAVQWQYENLKRTQGETGIPGAGTMSLSHWQRGTMTGLIGEPRYGGEEYDLVYLETWDPMDIQSPPETGAAGQVVEAYLASFPSDCSDLPTLEDVSRTPEDDSWQFFREIVTNNFGPFSTTVLVENAQRQAMITFLDYDGANICLVMDRTRQGGDVTVEYVETPDEAETLAFDRAAE